MGITYKQQKANQLNAQQSTGPTSPEGKAASSKNSTKHGLFAKCALMPGDDLEEYKSLLVMLHEEFNPIGGYKGTLVNVLADLFWRLRRILEMEGQILVYARHSIRHGFARGKVIEAENKAMGLDDPLKLSDEPTIKSLKGEAETAKAKVAEAEDSLGGAFLFNLKNGDPLAKLARHESRIRNEIRKIVVELRE